MKLYKLMIVLLFLFLMMSCSFKKEEPIIVDNVMTYQGFTVDLYHNEIIDYDISYSTDVIISDELAGESITKIADGVFQGIGLTSVQLDAHLEYSFEAFSDNNIKNVFINSHIFIGKMEFHNNPIESFKIGEDFNYTIEQLISLGLPSSIVGGTKFSEGFYIDVDTKTIIGYDDTYGLEVTIPDDFSYVNGDNEIIIDDIDSIGVFAFYDKNITDISFSSSIKNIRSFAFMSNHLTEIDISSSNIKNIGRYSFADNHLTKFIVNSSVTMDVFALEDNDELNEIECIDQPHFFDNLYTYLGMDDFLSMNDLDLIQSFEHNVGSDDSMFYSFMKYEIYQNHIYVIDLLYYDFEDPDYPMRFIISKFDLDFNLLKEKSYVFEKTNVRVSEFKIEEEMIHIFFEVYHEETGKEYQYVALDINLNERSSDIYTSEEFNIYIESNQETPPTKEISYPNMIYDGYISNIREVTYYDEQGIEVYTYAFKENVKINDFTSRNDVYIYCGKIYLENIPYPYIILFNKDGLFKEITINDEGMGYGDIAFIGDELLRVKVIDENYHIIKYIIDIDINGNIVEKYPYNIYDPYSTNIGINTFYFLDVPDNIIVKGVYYDTFTIEENHIIEMNFYHLVNNKQIIDNLTFRITSISISNIFIIDNNIYFIKIDEHMTYVYRYNLDDFFREDMN